MVKTGRLGPMQRVWVCGRGRGKPGSQGVRVLGQQGKGIAGRVRAGVHRDLWVSVLGALAADAHPA